MKQDQKLAALGCVLAIITLFGFAASGCKNDPLDLGDHKYMDSLKADADRHVKDTNRFVDSLLSASQSHLDSTLYYFEKNHDFYYKSQTAFINGNIKIGNRYADSCNHYNDLLQKCAHK